MRRRSVGWASRAYLGIGEGVTKALLYGLPAHAEHDGDLGLCEPPCFPLRMAETSL